MCTSQARRSFSPVLLADCSVRIFCQKSYRRDRTVITTAARQPSLSRTVRYPPASPLRHFETRETVVDEAPVAAETST